MVVVSAMSGVTNTLIEQAEYFSKNPNGKDMDMLLSSGGRNECFIVYCTK